MPETQTAPVRYRRNLGSRQVCDWRPVSVPAVPEGDQIGRTATQVTMLGAALADAGRSVRER